MKLFPLFVVSVSINILASADSDDTKIILDPAAKIMRNSVVDNAMYRLAPADKTATHAPKPEKPEDLDNDAIDADANKDKKPDTGAALVRFSNGNFPDFIKNIASRHSGGGGGGKGKSTKKVKADGQMSISGIGYLGKGKQSVAGVAGIWGMELDAEGKAKKESRRGNFGGGGSGPGGSGDLSTLPSGSDQCCTQRVSALKTCEEACPNGCDEEMTASINESLSSCTRYFNMCHPGMVTPGQEGSQSSQDSFPSGCYTTVGPTSTILHVNTNFYGSSEKGCKAPPALVDDNVKRVCVCSSC